MSNIGLKLTYFLVSLALLLSTGCPNMRTTTDDVGENAIPLNILEINRVPYDPPPQDPYDLIEMGIAFPDLPERVPIHRVGDTDFTLERATNLARTLGISADVIESERYFVARGVDRRSLEVTKSSGSIFFTTLDWELDTVMKDVLPLDNYKDLAAEWLVRTGLSDDALVHSGTSENTQTQWEDKKGTIERTSVNVGFRHKPINGVGFEGSGPRISIQFGDSGEVIGANSKSREIGEVVGEYPIISPENALKRIRNGEGRVFDSLEGHTATVNSLELIYTSEWEGGPQEYYIPYYKFLGVTTQGGHSFRARIIALPDDLYQINEPEVELYDYPPEAQLERSD